MAAPQKRTSNIVSLTVGDASVQVLGSNNQRAGFIVQNLSNANTVFLAPYRKGDGTSRDALQIPPTGIIAVDWGVFTEFYANCAAGLTADIVVFDVIGLDAFQFATVQLLADMRAEARESRKLLARIAAALEKGR